MKYTENQITHTHTHTSLHRPTHSSNAIKDKSTEKFKIKMAKSL